MSDLTYWALFGAGMVIGGVGYVLGKWNQREADKSDVAYHLGNGEMRHWRSAMIAITQNRRQAQACLRLHCGKGEHDI